MPNSIEGRENATQIISLTLGLVLLGTASNPLTTSWLGTLFQTAEEGVPLQGLATWLPALLLAGVAGLGAQMAARQRQQPATIAWPAPALLTALAAHVLGQAPSRLYWLLGMAGLAASLAALLFLSSLPARRGEEQAAAPEHILLRGGMYLVAWLAFAAAHPQGLPALPAAFGIAGLLSAQALSIGKEGPPPWGNCLALAWVQVGVGWILHLTPTSLWIAGAIQLLLLHAGLSLQEEEGSVPAFLGSILPSLAALALLGVALL